MAYSPISFIASNYRDYKYYWLKAYEPGTTTPKVIATDSTAATTIAKAQLNIDGFIVTAGSALFIPFVDDTYDLWLFPTEAEADTNDTSSALKLADSITGVNDINNLGANAKRVIPFESLSLAVAETDPLKMFNGATLNIKDDGNGVTYDWGVVLLSSITPREDDIVACAGVPTLALVRRNKGSNELFLTSEQLTKYTMTDNRHIFGEEYLWGFHKQIFASKNTNVNKFVWSGDSTTNGDNAGGYTPDLIGALVCGELGLARVTHIKSGHSGMAATDWNSTYVDADIAAHADMNVYVARWGINDGSAHGDVATYIAAMESGLSKLRAFKTVTDLAIVVVSPNSTYDPFIGRDENWYEQIIPELRKLCRKHQATFIDIYSIWQDAKQGGGKWYDQPNTGGGPAPIHPDASFALQIGVRITEMIVKPIMSGQNFAINKFSNADPDSFRPAYATLPSAYHRGISLWTVRTSDGWPYNGKLKVWRNGKKVIQELYKTNDDGVAEVALSMPKIMRIGDATSNTFTPWYGLAVTPILLNSWATVASRTPKYTHKENGLCSIMGTVGSGADGAIIFTLPVEMRPASPRTFIVAGDSVSGTIVILPNGNVQPYMNGGVFVNFDGVVWSAGD